MDDIEKEVVCKGIIPVFAFHEGLKGRCIKETDCFDIITGAILTGDKVMVVVNVLCNLEGLKLFLVEIMIKGVKDLHGLGVYTALSAHPCYLLLSYPILLQICLYLLECL